MQEGILRRQDGKKFIGGWVRVKSGESDKQMGYFRVCYVWPIKGAKANFPMSLDKVNHRRFIGCRHPAKLIIIDRQTGKTIYTPDTDSDVNDVFYDTNSKQIYLSCVGGYVEVFTQADTNTSKANGKIATQPGARTSLFISELYQLIVAFPSGFKGDDKLLIYEIIN